MSIDPIRINITRMAFLCRCLLRKNAFQNLNTLSYFLLKLQFIFELYTKYIVTYVIDI